MRAPARTVATGLRGCCANRFGRLAGYEDVNDAERLCRDPAMRWVDGEQEGSAYNVMPDLRHQRRPPPAPCTRLQPRHFLRTLSMPKTAEPWSLRFGCQHGQPPNFVAERPNGTENRPQTPSTPANFG
jgi:hypothetical protein